MTLTAPLYMLRHGETAWNTERRIESREDRASGRPSFRFFEDSGHGPPVARHSPDRARRDIGDVDSALWKVFSPVGTKNRT